MPETAAVAHVASAAAFAQRLSELGCRFALDDFGASFGSFYYLKHIPFDYLKIDGEFVTHCAHNTTDRALISAVVHIARNMGKYTIAEFAGDQQTVEVLTSLGVDFVQGYYLGGPAPLSEQVAASSEQAAAFVGESNAPSEGPVSPTNAHTSPMDGAGGLHHGARDLSSEI